MSRDLAPVAIIILVAEIFDSSFSPLIEIVLSELILPKPVKTLILFFFIKKLTPLLIVLATSLLLLITFSKFLEKFSTSMP